MLSVSMCDNFFSGLLRKKPNLPNQNCEHMGMPAALYVCSECVNVFIKKNVLNPSLRYHAYEGVAVSQRSGHVSYRP